MTDRESTTDARQRRLWPTAEPRPASEPLPPHAAGSATSRAAALSIADLAPGMRGSVYAHIVACRDRGATREEAAIALEMRMSTVAARANELLRLGLVREYGSRPTSSGRQAAVLVATPQEDA